MVPNRQNLIVGKIQKSREIASNVTTFTLMMPELSHFTMYLFEIMYMFTSDRVTFRFLKSSLITSGQLISAFFRIFFFDYVYQFSFLLKVRRPGKAVWLTGVFSIFGWKPADYVFKAVVFPENITFVKTGTHDVIWLYLSWSIAVFFFFFDQDVLNWYSSRYW